MWEARDAAAVAVVFFLALWALTRRPDRLSQVLFGGILVTLVFVILYFSVKFQNIVIGKDIFAQVAGYTLFLLWVSHLFRKNGFQFSPGPLNIAVCAFFLLSVLSAFLAPRWAWYYSLEEISRIAAMILLYFLTVRFLNTEYRWKIGLYAILTLMVVTSVYAILQIHGYDFMSWGFIVNVSTFGNKDFFASFLTYTFPIALFMAVGAKNVFDRILYLAMSGLALYNIIEGKTRGAWVGLMALAAVWILFEARLGRLREWLGGFKKQAIFWAAISAVLLALIPFVPAHEKETFRSIFQANRGTNIIRIYIWWASLRMWWDEPVIGQGLGTIQLTYPFFRPERYHRIGMSHNTRHAHSEELELLGEQGILGFSAWLAFIAIFFWLGLKKLRRIPGLSDRYLFFGLLSGMFAGLVHDSINVNLRWMTSAVTFWFLLAVCTRRIIGFDPPPDLKAARKSESRTAAWRPDWREWILAVPITAVFAFMFWMEWRVLRADWILKTVEGTIERDGGQERGIAAARQVLLDVPYDHSAYYKGAYGYLRLNRIDEAQAFYHRLMNMAPNYAQIHQNMALIAYRKFLAKGDLKWLYQAVIEFEWSTILENNYDNHFRLIQLYTQHLPGGARHRYHNRYLFWNAKEDSVFNAWRYYYGIGILPNAAESVRRHYYDEYMKSVDEGTLTYWLYRVDLAKQLGRPMEEQRYTLNTAILFKPDHRDLVNLALNSLLLDPSSDRPEDRNQNILTILRIIEGLPPESGATEIWGRIRQELEHRAALPGRQADPVLTYALGVAAYRQGDMDRARTWFSEAKSLTRQRTLLDGIAGYGI